MKFFRNHKALLMAAAATIAAGFGARGELSRWAENIDAAGRLEAVFFRSVTLPGGAIPVRRPPKETRAELGKLMQNAPTDAELYSLRALEAEQQLDFAAAESDWKKYTEVAADKPAARVALADFYHRRLLPNDEFAALALAANDVTPASEQMLSTMAQRPSRIYERILQLAEEQALPVEQTVIQYRLWINHYRKESSLYGRLHAFAVSKKRMDFAEETSRAYELAIPEEAEYAVIQRATAAASAGENARALGLYEAAFRPLWPAPLVKTYFDLLKRTSSLRKFLEQARAAVGTDPAGINGPARLFYYYQQQGDLAAAQRALAEFALRKDARKSAWTAVELSTLAELYQSINNWDDAARYYYALYSLPNVTPADAERGLGGLVGLLLNAPEQGIRFGAGNLTFWKDAATMDANPGFLNGVLSLLMNSSDPAQRYSSQNQASLAYFHRAKAAELLTLFDNRLAASPQRPILHARLIEAYAVYGDADATIRDGRKFLTNFPNAPNRTGVASTLADAYAQKGQAQQEFALYEDLLKEFAAKVGGVPIGNHPSVVPPRPAGESADGEEPSKAPAASGSARSPEYARILDRYLARLVSLKRTRDALALYRREVDRNPNDPGLYERLAGFLDQNKLTTEIEGVYQKAIQKFQDKSWTHKLARWYIRQKQFAQLDKLTQDVVRTFEGTELETYFRDAVPSGTGGAAFSLQLNRYAARKFPHNLTFVRNLLSAYTTRPTVDAAGYEALLRKNWYYADDLRARFFELMSRTNRLDAELQAIRTQNPIAEQNPAAVRLLAEGDAWRSHFESAAPLFDALHASYPANASIAARASSIDRSLSAFDSTKFAAAVSIEARRNQADPRDTATLARRGEIEAERDRLDLAKPHWDRISNIEPGKAQGYLESATVFWDYYQYDDALRKIEEGRKKLGDSALFAYESGAIHENKRDYDRAIAEYARGALASYARGQTGAIAESRLLSLARRPALRAKVDQLTANLSSARTPSQEGFALRIALLRSQNRRDDLERFLLDVSTNANSQELLARAENWGRVEGFAQVQQKSLERQVALTTDPVDKMRARITLARFFESQGKTAEGGQAMDALLRDNQNILGVVRATVDYHARNSGMRRAADVLVEAAGRSTAGFKKNFTFEAARKSIAGSDYARARTLLNGLLTEDPWNAEYLSAMADTFGRQNDDRGLRAFYQDQLQALRAAQMPAVERNNNAAALRRSLIPVLTRMADYAGALDQYIEVINRFPDDAALVREAAIYANRWTTATFNAKDKLLDFYRKTQGEAPRDSRWPIVLAQFHTQFEDFPAAITSYTRAAEIRPDRADWLMARAGLEERLLRFDDASKTYTRLYEMTYRDSQWMDKLATAAARQAKYPEAIGALRRAWLEGRPDRAVNYATIAERLESWNLQAEAMGFAEEALKRADENEKPAMAMIFGRLATKARKYETAYPRAPLASMGPVVAENYTPEEKTAFGVFLAKYKGTAAVMNAVRGAKLVDLEAKWLYEAALVKRAGGLDSISRLMELQRSRLKFDELGAQLEAYWKVLPPDNGNRDGFLLQAADAYRSAGNSAAELRALTAKDQVSGLDGQPLERFASLLIGQPQRFAAAAGKGVNESQENSLVDYALRHGTLSQATQAIEARGRKINPLWTRAHTALTGVYFASAQPSTRTAFTSMLNDTTIGERIGKQVDRNQMLAGDNWYYFGARYGEYLLSQKQPTAPDYLPAELEHTPGRGEAYFQLAEQYREQGDRAQAAIEYRHVLELAPNRPDVHDRLALLAMADGKTADAAAEWKLTFDLLAAQQNASRVPASFWTTLENALRHAGQGKAIAPLRADISKLLGTYFRRNGAYQAEPLLRGVLAASPDPAGGIAWITELSRAAVDPPQFVASFVEADWVPDGQRDALHQDILRGAAAKLAQSFGDARQSARAQQRAWQTAYIQFLLERKEFERARAVFPELKRDAVQYGRWDLLPLEARIAARSRTMPTLLASLTQNPDDTPNAEVLRRAATALQDANEPVAARALLRWTYDRELSMGNTDASTFLGAAEVRLEENDTAGALAMLRRMTLLAGEPFDTLDAAADLLDRFQKKQEALEFASAAAKAKPWDFDYRRRAAEWRGDTAELSAVLTANAASYTTRVRAAQALRRAKVAAPQTSSVELTLLTASTPIADAAASAAYFFPALIEAAAQTQDAAARVKLLSAAVAVAPHSTVARQALFDAAALTRGDRLTIAIYEREVGFGEEASFEPFMAEQFLNGAGLDSPKRALAARRIAEARQRTGTLTLALTLFRIAEKLEPSEAAKAPLRRTIATLAAQIDRRNANDARRPMITSSIEQDRAVRPRLAAAAQGVAR